MKGKNLKTYRAEVIETMRCSATFQFTAEDDSVARLRAIELMAGDPHKKTGEPFYEFKSLRQIGEPWAYSHGWYMDREKPSDIIVVERSEGDRFKASDIRILRRRIVKLGFPVLDSWNGAGCATVSFRCSGRRGLKALTKSQLSILVAPR